MQLFLCLWSKPKTGRMAGGQDLVSKAVGRLRVFCSVCGNPCHSICLEFSARMSDSWIILGCSSVFGSWERKWEQTSRGNWPGKEGRKYLKTNPFFRVAFIESSLHRPSTAQFYWEQREMKIKIDDTLKK